MDFMIGFEMMWSAAVGLPLSEYAGGSRNPRRVGVVRGTRERRGAGDMRWS